MISARKLFLILVIVAAVSIRSMDHQTPFSRNWLILGAIGVAGGYSAYRIYKSEDGLKNED
jgi:hypothetical protein